MSSGSGYRYIWSCGARQVCTVCRSPPSTSSGPHRRRRDRRELRSPRAVPLCGMVWPRRDGRYVPSEIGKGVVRELTPRHQEDPSRPFAATDLPVMRSEPERPNADLVAEPALPQGIILKIHTAEQGVRMATVLLIGESWFTQLTE